jgi:hypothetical protein
LPEKKKQEQRVENNAEKHNMTMKIVVKMVEKENTVVNVVKAIQKGETVQKQQGMTTEKKEIHWEEMRQKKKKRDVKKHKTEKKMKSDDVEQRDNPHKKQLQFFASGLRQRTFKKKQKSANVPLDYTSCSKLWNKRSLFCHFSSLNW